VSEQATALVYGATGFTGRLVCAELARRGVRFAVAGRDGEKLRGLAGRVGGPEIAVAALDDRAALERAAARAKVVIDCAGPFAKFGRPVLDAALAAGSHFLDITGEHAWLRECLGRDGEAKARGVAVVNAVGFDVIPTDAAAALAAEAAGAPVARLRIAFATRGGRPTQGTLRSAIGMAREGGLAFVDGEWRHEPIATERWQVPFPEPIGPRECISVPWGDVVTAPRSTGARAVRCFMPSPMQRQLARPALMRLLPPLLAIRPVTALAERWIGRLPEGPSAEARARARFAVVAEAEGARGTHTAWVTGGDGYDFTAASAVECALRAADPAFAARGALTPSQAFGARALLDALAFAGVRWGVE
jgi:short subunit dehydrogenase-like uncharacterized protein